MSRRGFTLVELLVVVAVIALVMGLLLPALSSARAAARAGACAVGARQLALANDAYASDHADRFAPGAPAIAQTNLKRWHGTRSNASLPFSSKGGPITAYLDAEGSDAPGVRRCPSFTLDHSTAGPGAFERSAGGYGYNNAFVGTSRRRTAPGIWTIETDALGARRSIFRTPHTTAQFADAALIADTLIEYSFIEPVFWPEYPGARPDPSIHFRHAGSASIIWLDGHASSERLTFSAASGLYEGSPLDWGVGWFGETTSNNSFAP